MGLQGQRWRLLYFQKGRAQGLVSAARSPWRNAIPQAHARGDCRSICMGRQPKRRSQRTQCWSRGCNWVGQEIEERYCPFETMEILNTLVRCAPFKCTVLDGAQAGCESVVIEPSGLLGTLVHCIFLMRAIAEGMQAGSGDVIPNRFGSSCTCHRKRLRQENKRIACTTCSCSTPQVSSLNCLWT